MHSALLSAIMYRMINIDMCLTTAIMISQFYVSDTHLTHLVEARGFEPTKRFQSMICIYLVYFANGAIHVKWTPGHSSFIVICLFTGIVTALAHIISPAFELYYWGT